jgi:hypothetical protein
MPPNEIFYAEKFIYQRLYSNSDLVELVSGRIYARRAKQGATTPYILYNFQGGDDALSHNKVRLIAQPLFWVRVITGLDGNTSSIPQASLDAAELMDDLLHTARRVEVVGITGYSFNSWRIRPRTYSEQPPDNPAGEILHIGGDYRVQVFS